MDIPHLGVRFFTSKSIRTAITKSILGPDFPLPIVLPTGGCWGEMMRREPVEQQVDFPLSTRSGLTNSGTGAAGGGLLPYTPNALFIRFSPPSPFRQERPGTSPLSNQTLFGEEEWVEVVITLWRRVFL